MLPSLCPRHRPRANVPRLHQATQTLDGVVWAWFFLLVRYSYCSYPSKLLTFRQCVRQKPFPWYVPIQTSAGALQTSEQGSPPGQTRANDGHDNEIAWGKALPMHRHDHRRTRSALIAMAVDVVQVLLAM